MTQLIFGIQAALIAINTGITGLDLADSVTTIVIFVCSVALAFIGPFIPKVSAMARKSMGLARRG